ncbi:SLBB domain-containing protein [Candidatus Daviesbacteria bacterium]|nr:SLBB domain-containing protein [Candidatus Daviesbacteria bacterium]
MQSINNFLNDYKLALILCFLGLVLILGGILSSGLLAKLQKPLENKPFVQTTIKVDVAGAINKPGVYSLKSGDRIQDLIGMAGGFLENADPLYISKNLNLSAKLVDGQKIYIPFKGEKTATTPEVVGVSNTSLIGINGASKSKLEELPAVGPATASKIMNGRPYADISELISKKIVSRSVYEKIKDLIDLN